MSSKPITGVMIEQRVRGGYILRTSTGVMCLGSKVPAQLRTEETTTTSLNDEAFHSVKSAPLYSYDPGKKRQPKKHRHNLTEEQIKYCLDQHNNHGKSWLSLSRDVPCSDTLLRDVCAEYCAKNMPDEVYKLRCKARHIKVNEDALVADYQDGMRLKDIGRRYHICDSRVYNILRKRGMVL